MVAAEYQEHFGDHAYDDEGNYIGAGDSEGQQAWEDYYSETGEDYADDEGEHADPGSAGDEVAAAADEASDVPVDET